MNTLLEDIDDEGFVFESDHLDEDDDEDNDDEAFEERRPRLSFRRGVPRIQRTLTSQRGVSSATLNTPSGSARLKLPTAVVPLETFNKTVASLREAHNQLATQVNANRDAIKKVSEQTAGMQRTLARERRRGRESSLMSSLMGMMAAQQVNQRIDQIPGAPANTTNPMMLMMIPMMSMMEGDGGKESGGNGMMMMMMMMAMMGAMGPAPAAHT